MIVVLPAAEGIREDRNRFADDPFQFLFGGQDLLALLFFGKDRQGGVAHRVGADGHPEAGGKVPQFLVAHGPLGCPAGGVEVSPAAELRQPFRPPPRIKPLQQRVERLVESLALPGRGSGKAMPAIPVLQLEVLRQGVFAQEEPFQFIPPVLLQGIEVAGADEKGGRHSHFLQDGQGGQGVIRIAVVKGNGDGGLVDPAPVVLEADQGVVFLEIAHLGAEVFRGDGEPLRVGRQGGDPVIDQDHHRDVDAVEQPVSGPAGRSYNGSGEGNWHQTAFLATMVINSW